MDETQDPTTATEGEVVEATPEVAVDGADASTPAPEVDETPAA